jgi:hypothetical protein
MPEVLFDMTHIFPRHCDARLAEARHQRLLDRRRFGGVVSTSFGGRLDRVSFD